MIRLSSRMISRSLTSWCTTNKVCCLNKCCHISFFEINIKIKFSCRNNSFAIKYVSTAKYLSVWFNEDLRYKVYINNLLMKALKLKVNTQIFMWNRFMYISLVFLNWSMALRDYLCIRYILIRWKAYKTNFSVFCAFRCNHQFNIFM